ncbi:TRAP transporter small permease [Paracoccus tibetensis]|uniref:TRAP transporter small permease protein n=1 Tax=Paracoccus tibetensis TaxID=336292 RepID=A0A1G5D2J6_9RHOB|nr:TRAP transporter small permease [Paracoccus tibetensis]SCY08757.1 TRAP-type C4-dicarboxylate transport system, small permease component [Paracoccus tibetensis]
MEALTRWTDRLIGLSAFVGTAGLLFVVGVILVDVIGRNFGRPLYGAQDMVTMTMVLIVFGGMALCDRLDGHIVVDIFEGSFPEWLNRVIDIASALLGAVIFALIAWAIWNSAQLSQMLNLSTNLLRLPLAWFQYAVVAFSGVTVLALLMRAGLLLAGAPRKSAEGAL